MESPLLIALPHGLGVSGVSTWGVRLARALAGRGRPVGMIVHDEPAGHRAIEMPLPPGVAVFDARGLPAIATGDLAATLDRYRHAVETLGDAAGAPVVFSPNLDGNCYGLAAALTREMPDRLRIVGWQHNDTRYDSLVLAHFAPVVTRFVAVSATIATALRRRLPDRAGDVVEIPYGVPVADAASPRVSRPGQPLRLVYAGRLEHNQKRIGAVLALARELERRGLAHELTVIGDGPASAAVDVAAACQPGLRRLPASPWPIVRTHLSQADVFLLASRFEGLCVAMLEAMGQGAVPIVTAVASGADQVIESGYNGMLVDTRDDQPDDELAAAIADGIERARPDLADMSRRAWETTRDRFTLDTHADAVAALLDDVAGAGVRAWPEDQPWAFSGPDAGGFATVPCDAATRMTAMLDHLDGRRVVLHGAGRHTREIASRLDGAPVTIVAVTDDDRQTHGARIGAWPIVAPERVETLGVTDVVISSWLHEDAIWQRRALYERQGLRVHRLYTTPASSDTA